MQKGQCTPEPSRDEFQDSAQPLPPSPQMGSGGALSVSQKRTALRARPSLQTVLSLGAECGRVSSALQGLSL